MSVSEAVERNIRNAHDKHLLLNEMKQLEATIQSREKDIQRQQEELALERQKHKATYLEKLAAERRVAELLVSKSRLEVRRGYCLQQWSMEIHCFPDVADGIGFIAAKFWFSRSRT